MRPVLFYDSDSQLMRARVARWHRMTIQAVQYIPYDDAHGILPDFLGPPPKPDAETLFHLVEDDGEVYTGAAAATRLWKYTPRQDWKYTLAQRYKKPNAILDSWYSQTARHRSVAERLHWLLSGVDEEPPTYYATRWIFLRVMGLVWAIAFGSFWWQAMGLIGSEGLLPADTYMENIGASLEMEAHPVRGFIKYPTLLHFAASDLAIHAICGVGLVAGLLLMVGFLPQLAALACWLAYLSLFQAARDFLGFQWDTLLLEAGFLTIFFAPCVVRPRSDQGSVPSLAMLWLLRILCARLMLSSGLSKLGGETWMDLSALTYHFETQPLPHLLSWHAHHLPAAVLMGGVLLTFLVEILIPLFVFAPRRLRAFAGRSIILFMLLIIATGNFGFFNLLTIALALTFFDDIHVRRWFASTAFARIAPPPVRSLPPWPRYALVFLVVVITVPIQTYYMCGRIAPVLVTPLKPYVYAVAPWHFGAGYGLFSRVSTTRPELIIEGSSDGTNWEAYEWPFKAGSPDRAPRWAQPHMPRIDWQLWFEALRAERGDPPEPWFQNLLARLLEGEEGVTQLLAENPFEENPPNYIRATLYQYRFTTREEHDEDGAWWVREERGIYLGPVELSPMP